MAPSQAFQRRIFGPRPRSRHINRRTRGHETMPLQEGSMPQQSYRRQLLRGAAAIGSVAVGATLGLLPRTALACHTYVSSVDGAKGCGAYTRDLASQGSSSSSSSSGSAARAPLPRVARVRAARAPARVRRQALAVPRHLLGRRPGHPVDQQLRPRHHPVPSAASIWAARSTPRRRHPTATGTSTPIASSPSTRVR